MSTVIQNLIDAGYDVHSYFKCAREVNDKYTERHITPKIAEKEIHKLFGVTFPTENNEEANVALRYMITEAVKLHADGFVVDPEELTKVVKRKVAEFFINFPWYDPNVESTIKDIPTADEILNVPTEEILLTRKQVNGQTVKPKKGLKQEAAKLIYEANRGKSNQEIIALFIGQLDMSKAGATTYLYNMKKAAGDITEGTKKGRKPKVVS
jgi:hypothetical protein